MFNPSLNMSRRRIAASIAALMSLTACSSMQQANTLKTATLDEINQAKAKPIETPVVISRSGAWLAGAKVAVAKPTLPILDKEFAYHPTSAVGLSDIASWITQTTGMPVDVSELQGATTGSNNSQAGMLGVGQVNQPNGMINNAQFGQSSPYPTGTGAMNGQPVRESMWRMNINYDGKLSGLLDVAANKAGGWWRVEEGRIIFFKTLTKTFFLAAPSQKFIGTETLVTATGGGAGSSSGSTSSSGSNTTATSSSSNISTYTFDLWADLEKTAKAVAAGAQIAANASTGTITVTGTPAQVRQVEQWAKQQNEKLSQQVAITVRMFTVKLTSEDYYSWDPSVVFKSAGGVMSGTLAGPQVPTIASGMSPGVLGLSVGGTGSYTGSTAAYKALSTLGNVTETMNETFVALNAHPLPKQLVNSQGYICNVSASQTANVGTTSTITQCPLTTGFSALFVPNVVNGKVILEMKITNSTNNGFTTTPPQNGSYVQTANVDTNKFEQAVSLTPGDALLLTSMQRDTGAESNSGIGSAYNPIFGGGASGARGKTIVAIMVTAKIL